MSDQVAAASARQTAAPERSSKGALMLQRKCDCGQHTLGGGECAQCRQRRLELQRWSSGRPGPAALLDAYRGPTPAATIDHGRGLDLSGLPVHASACRGSPARQGPTVEARPNAEGASSRAEGTAEVAAYAAAGSPAPAAGAAAGAQPSAAETLPAAPATQQVPSPEPTPAAEASPAPEASPPEPAQALPEAGAAASPGSALIVEDHVTDPLPGQLRKSEFLDQLQPVVCAEAEAALAGTEHSAQGCPYISFWFGYYRKQSGDHIQRALHGYVPQVRSARSASEYIPAIAAHVRRAVEDWVRTGEVTGVPEGAPSPAADQVGAAQAGKAPSAVHLKARDGRGTPSDDPAVVQARLGAGQPLESGVRSRMEHVFGRSFSGVRSHTDQTASRLSNEQNARAFTVGRHVAFGAGEYRPGTVVGDALIAHELAHVVQQHGGAAAPSATSARGGSYTALENDADRSAEAALLSMWGTTSSMLAEIRTNAIPRLRSGLRLQRCAEVTSTKKQPSMDDGCVTGNLTVRTAGALQGGWSVNDYLGGGLNWGGVTAPKTAGADGTGFKVQQFAPFTGRENLGVSQTMRHGNSNQAFLDGTAAYLGKRAGSVKNGQVHNEPVLNAADPFAATGWNLLYKDGMVSFADVPRGGAGDKGHIDFATCFHSKSTACEHTKCCATWRWAVDFTAGNNTNTVTTRSQQCT